MSDLNVPRQEEAERAARQQGRGEGLALAALVLGIVSFINLLGAEKGILAVVLGILARREAATGAARTRGTVGMSLGAIQLATVVVVLIVFRRQLGQLVELLGTLG